MAHELELEELASKVTNTSLAEVYPSIGNNLKFQQPSKYCPWSYDSPFIHSSMKWTSGALIISAIIFFSYLIGRSTSISGEGDIDEILLQWYLNIDWILASVLQLYLSKFYDINASNALKYHDLVSKIYHILLSKISISIVFILFHIKYSMNEWSLLITIIWSLTLVRNIHIFILLNLMCVILI